jgi:predicted ATP-grasp superfamily ATP-dependent carboligase
MRVIVAEYLSATGGEGFGPGAAREGLAMLKAAAADLRALPGVQVRTPIYEGLCGPGEFPAWLAAELPGADAALIIAPETDGLLSEFTAEVEASGKLLLGSASAAVSVAADKLATAQRLTAAGVPTPPTAAQMEAGWSFPLVVKPRDGCGSKGVRLLHGPDRIPEGSVVQPYIEGAAVSVSLLAAAEGVMPISLNSQIIRLYEGAFAYCGGRTAIAHPMQVEAFAVAAAAVRAIPGLCGYVGVDLILTADGPQVVDINPRLTTAYTGLRVACDCNLMGAVLEAAGGGRLPRAPLTVRSIAYGTDGPVEEGALW